jgi:hypothetical protein
MVNFGQLAKKKFNQTAEEKKEKKWFLGFPCYQILIN